MKNSDQILYMDLKNNDQILNPVFEFLKQINKVTLINKNNQISKCRYLSIEIPPKPTEHPFALAWNLASPEDKA